MNGRALLAWTCLVTIFLRNPHSVLAALSERPADVLEIRLSGTKPHGAWQEVVDRARHHRVAITQIDPREKEMGRRGRQGPSDDAGRTTPAEAIVRPREEWPLEQLLSAERVQAAPRGLWLALDQIQDPHNVGAIFRTAAFFGVQGILMTRDRSSPLTGTVYDVASGGVEAVPFSQRANLAQALEVAKKSGVWVLGTSEHAEQDVAQISRDRPWLLVLGNEERGLRQLTLKTCDEICRLTPRGPVSSLNVSVAAAVLVAALSPGAESPVRSSRRER